MTGIRKMLIVTGILSLISVLGLFAESQVVCVLEIKPTVIQPTCYGVDNGSISVLVIKGTRPYTFSWSNGSTSEKLSELGEGEYILTVSDASGCTATDTFHILYPPPIEIKAELSRYGDYNIKCHGDHNGSIDIKIDEKSHKISYSGWYGTPYMPENSNFSGNEKDLKKVPAGKYIYKMISVRGCEASDSFVLKEPQPLKIEAEISDYSGFAISCHGEADGHITAIAEGGHDNLPYEYYWSDQLAALSNSDSVLQDLEAGTYALKVADAFGCESAVEFTLEAPPAVTLEGINGSTSVLGKEQRAYYVPDQKYVHYSWSVVHGTIVGPDDRNAITVQWPAYSVQGQVNLIQEHLNGCAYRNDTLFVDVQGESTAIEELTKAVPEIKVSPNPAVNDLYVHLSKVPSPRMRYSIYDMTGKELINGKFENSDRIHLSVSDLNPGIYFLRVQLQQKSSVSRFMIRR